MPDYIVERKFEHAGYECVVLFLSMGHRCGYVGIPKKHPLYGKDYMDIEDFENEKIGKRKIVSLSRGACDDAEKSKAWNIF